MRHHDYRIGEDYDCYSIPIKYVYDNKMYSIMNYGGPYFSRKEIEPYFWLSISQLNLSSQNTIKIYMTKPEYVIKSRKDVNNILTRNEVNAMIDFFKSDPLKVREQYSFSEIDDLESYCLDEYSRITNKSWKNIWEYFIDKINCEEGCIAMPINLPMPDYSKLPTKSF